MREWPELRMLCSVGSVNSWSALSMKTCARAPPRCALPAVTAKQRRAAGWDARTAATRSCYRRDARMLQGWRRGCK